MKTGLPIIIACFLLPVIFCGGCGTILTHTGDPGSDMGNMFRKNGVYRGVRFDSSFIGSEESTAGLRVCGVIDFPFSLSADTLVFPYDLVTLHSQEPENSN
jgi:uncharacterized protein YceK